MVRFRMATKIKKYEDIFKKNSVRSKDLVLLLSNWENDINNIRRFFLDEIEAKVPRNVKGRFSEPGPLLLKLAGTSENAYKYAFLKGKQAQINFVNGKSIKLDWLDMEVPVMPGENPRRRCLDLIGKTREGNKADFVIAELKKEGGDSPFYAAYEAIFYALSVKNNTKELVHHPSFDGAPIENYWKYYKNCKYLIVAATNKYWEMWKDHLNKLKDISSWVENKYKYKLIYAEFNKVDFKTQKQNSVNGKYSPSVPNEIRIWNQVQKSI